MRSRAAVGLILLAATATGCVNWYDTSAVKGTFVTAQSCPSDRVTVTSTGRPDWLEADPPGPPPPPPPPDIAADPQRRALYYQTNQPHANDPYAKVPFYYVQGCGVTVLYMCPLVANDDGASVSPVCQPAPVKPTP